MRIAVAVFLVVLSVSPSLAECNISPTDGNEAVNGLGPLVVDVLANANDADGHLLTVAVDSTTCPGTASVEFEMIALDPEPRLVDDCLIRYTVRDELGGENASTIQITMQTAIFSDNFEDGSAAAWSSSDGGR